MTRVLSTLWAPGESAWSDVDVLDRRELSKPRFVARLVRQAPGYDVTVISGTSRFRDLYQELWAAMLLGRRRRPPKLVVAETAWDLASAPLAAKLHLSEQRLAGLVRLAVRALDGPHVTYCVLSEEERSLFAEAFGVPEDRVCTTHFGHSLWSGRDRATSEGDYVFAGGDSLRDYDTFLSAVHDLDVRVRLATTRSLDHVPPHVEAGPLDYENFTSGMANAAVVVVPLLPTRRSAGIMTYVSAMALGKLVIVTDAPAVREYVTDGVTGLLVPPQDPRALCEAISWGLDPGNRAERIAIGERARGAARDPGDYWSSLRAVAEHAAIAP